MSIILLLALESMILATATVDAPPESVPPIIVASEVPVHLRFKIENGLHRAHRALDRHPACRDLFRELGADGETSLAELRFHLASPEQSRSICSERSEVDPGIRTGC